MKMSLFVLLSLLGLNSFASTVVNEDFESAISSNFSNLRLSQAAALSRYAGRYGNESLGLSLNLPAGDYSLSFDLYLIDSWDGNAAYGGPDRFIVKKDGTDLFNHYFTQWSNKSTNQSYYPIPAGTYRAGYFTGNYSTPDSVYRLTMNFSHSGGPLSLAFSGSGLQSISDESWGVDNLTIDSLNSAPEAKIRGANDSITTSTFMNLTGETINLKSNGVVQAHLRVDPNGTSLVTLDGSSSQDADGDELSFSWTITSLDDGSIFTSESAIVELELPVGNYSAELSVSDGKESSVVSSSFSVSLLDLSILEAEDIALNGISSTQVSFEDDQLNAKFSIQELAPVLDSGNQVELFLSGKVRGSDTVRIK